MPMVSSTCNQRFSDGLHELARPQVRLATVGSFPCSRPRSRYEVAVFVSALRATIFLMGGAMLVSAQTPSVGNMRIDFISHSQARVRFDLNAPACMERVRYGLDSRYEQGAGGGIQDFHSGQAWCGQNDIGGQISGLAP